MLVAPVGTDRLVPVVTTKATGVKEPARVGVGVGVFVGVVVGVTGIALDVGVGVGDDTKDIFLK